MKTNEVSNSSEVTRNLNGTLFSKDAFVAQATYRELADQPLQHVHPLDQLEMNLEILAETRARLQFLMREVRYVMKVD